MIQSLQNIWSRLEPREQRLLKITLPLAVVMLLYLVVVQPLQKWQLNKNQQSNQYLQIQQKLQHAQTKLSSINGLKIQQWHHLAESYDLENISINQEGGIWLLQAEARSLDNIQGFLSAVTENGGYWRQLHIQSNPIKLQVEWISI